MKRRPGWVRTCIAKCATKRWSLTPPGNAQSCAPSSACPTPIPCLSFTRAWSKTKPGLDAKRAWLPITRGLKGLEIEMRTEDLERFEAAAGDLLDELGYERAFLNPGPQVLEHATELRDSLAQEMQSQTGYPLPKHL